MPEKFVPAPPRQLPDLNAAMADVLNEVRQFCGGEAELSKKDLLSLARYIALFDKPRTTLGVLCLAQKYAHALHEKVVALIYNDQDHSREINKMHESFDGQKIELRHETKKDVLNAIPLRCTNLSKTAIAAFKRAGMETVGEVRARRIHIANLQVPQIGRKHSFAAIKLLKELDCDW